MIIARVYPKRKKNKVELLKEISFKCKRCGKFCCSLGAPNLTKDDERRLRKIFGKDFENIIEKRRFKGKYKGLTDLHFKNEKQGCCFLKFRNNKVSCSIYKDRPLLCQIYPFHIENKKDKLEISILPCFGIKQEKNKNQKKQILDLIKKWADA